MEVVYLVVHWEQYEGSTVYGAFSSLAKADAFIAKQEEYIRESLYVDSYEVDNEES